MAELIVNLTDSRQLIIYLRNLRQRGPSRRTVNENELILCIKALLGSR